MSARSSQLDVPACRTPELAGLELNRNLVQSHSQAGFLVVTFSNKGGAAMALNWAKQLHSLGGIRSLVGLNGPLSGGALTELRQSLPQAGAGVFCADGLLARVRHHQPLVLPARVPAS